MQKHSAMGVILIGTPAGFFFTTYLHQQPGKKNKIQWWLWSLWTPQKVGNDSSEERRIKLNNLSYCRSSCTSETQVSLTDRWVSQGAQTPGEPSTWATQTLKAMLQMGKAVAIPKCRDRWARSIFNNTRTPLCLYHWRDAERAQPGSLAQLMEKQKFWPDILMFWDLWPAWGQPSFRWDHWPSAPQPTPQAKRNQTTMIYFKALQ